MSDVDSDKEDVISDDEMELTAEELAAAEASMAAKRANKEPTSGDILIDLDLESEKTNKSKKYLDPGEFGCSLLRGELGESYIDFAKPRLNTELGLAKALEKVDIAGDFLKQHTLRYAMSAHAKAKEKEAKKKQNAGKRWFEMAAPEMSEEVKNDMRLLKYRQVWDSTTKAKKSDRRGTAPFFQVGTIADSAEDFYSARLTKKERGKTLVDQLMNDVEFRRTQRKKKANMRLQSMENRGNPMSKKRKLKKK